MENIIEEITVGKFVFTLYKRENTERFSNCPFAVLFKQLTPNGKYSKSKVLKHYVYKNLDEARSFINTYAKNIKSNIEVREKRKAEKRAANAEIKAASFYKVGDIIVNSWGWEQTNINFYQVVRVTNKTIEIKEIESKIVDGSMYAHGMACDVVPKINSFLEIGASYKLRVYANGRLSCPKSYYYMKKWDGRPMGKSWYA